MKTIKRLILVIVLLIPCICFADGVSVSKSSVNVYVGDTTTITVSASGAYATVTPTLSGGSASVDATANFYVENDGAGTNVTKTITVRGLSVGSSSLKLHFYGATYEPVADFERDITVTINVTERPTTTTTTTQPRTTVQGSTRASMQVTTQQVETTASSNLYFTSLTVDEYEVTEEDGVYYVTVDSNREAVEINASAPEGIVISGTGKRNLVYGKNTVNLTLSEPNGEAKSVQLVITRPDLGNKNTLLKQLEVVNYKLDFDPNTKEYTITVPYGVKEVYIYALAQSDDTTVKGDGKFTLAGNETNAFVTVSYGNAASTTYTIHIKKSYLGLVPIILLAIGLIGTTGGLFFLSNKLNETKEELNNALVKNRADAARALEDLGPQLSVNGSSATGIGARVVKPQAVQPVKVVQAKPTTTVGMVPPTEMVSNDPVSPMVPNPQVKVVKVVKPVNTVNTIKQVNTSEVQ